MPLLRFAREHAIETLEQLAGTERLREIRGKSERGEPLRIAMLVQGGEHDEPRSRQLAVGVDALAERRTIHVGHPVIYEHGFERMLIDERLPHERERFDTAARERHFVARMHELTGNDATVRLVVVDYEEPATEARQVGLRIHAAVARRFEGQREPETRSLAELALHANLAAHHFDEPTHDRQAEPGAAEMARRRGIRLNERPEQRAQGFARNTDAGVAHFESRQRPSVAVFADVADFDDDLAGVRELDRIAHEVQ